MLLLPSETAALSGAVHEFIDKQTDETGAERSYLPSLKYYFPAAAKPNEKPKPLSSDQRIQNAAFLRECRQLWAEAMSELDDRVAAGGVVGPPRAERAEGKEAEEKEEKEEEGEAEKEEVRGAGESQSMNKVLTDLSIKVLRQWLEEDEDRLAAKRREEGAERVSSSRRSHEQFVKHKNRCVCLPRLLHASHVRSLRIKLPPASSVEPTRQASFSFGKALTGVRPTNAHAPLSTAELMCNSGLKYVHALGKGRDSMKGDLERSRDTLLNLGFVARENFDADPDSGYSMQAFGAQRRGNKAATDKRDQEQRMHEASGKAYDEWLELKELRDAALRHLSFVPAPTGLAQGIAQGSLASAVPTHPTLPSLPYCPKLV